MPAPWYRSIKGSATPTPSSTRWSTWWPAACWTSGSKQGDRLGIWSPNYAEWVLVQYATAKIGVILVNINPAYRTSELAYALNQSGCRVLVAAPRSRPATTRRWSRRSGRR